jgi:hypothetical protein
MLADNAGEMRLVREAERRGDVDQCCRVALEND